jgi:3-phosphoshikimate 1-carboxyvinyltransferase
MTVRAIEPIVGPIDATVIVPGSKSLTNRALVCAALADGISTIEGGLVADDTEAMIEALRALGAGIDERTATLVVTGTGGRLAPGPRELDMRLSGTTSRFLLPVVALGSGRYRADGRPGLRRRPMGPVLDGLRQLGASVEPEGEPGHLPVTIVAPGGLRGGDVEVSGDTSSQYISGLLLAAPYTRDGVRLRVTTTVVGRPFVDLTLAAMAAFGVDVEVTEPPGADPAPSGATGASGSSGSSGGSGASGSSGSSGGSAASGGSATPGTSTAAGLELVVPAGRYRSVRYLVEPDASAASYLLAAAAICGGRVTVDGLGRQSQQGDAGFAALLGAMGARVERTASATTVTGTGELEGLGDVDLSAMPDMAQTLAAVAVFADGPTRVRGVGFIRGHETDRVAAVVRELRRCGIEADEEPDGFVVRPGTPGPARIATYGDHRMAMSFALLGLRRPGIEIEDPGCVAKTFPDFWDVLEGLRS